MQGCLATPHIMPKFNMRAIPSIKSHMPREVTQPCQINFHKLTPYGVCTSVFPLQTHTSSQSHSSIKPLFPSRTTTATSLIRFYYYFLISKGQILLIEKNRALQVHRLCTREGKKIKISYKNLGKHQKMKSYQRRL